MSGRSNVGFMGLDPAKDQAGVWGGNLSVPTAIFREVGGFDDGFVGWGAEDADLVGRMVKAGAAVRWVSESVGRHLEHPFRVYHREAIGTKRYWRNRGAT